MNAQRVFLDANVLFSAAYRPDAGLRRLWTMPQIALLTSVYAIAEARRNLDQPSQLADLDSLTSTVAIAPEPAVDPGRNDYGLPEKDRPILWAAIDAKVTILLTGDRRHFGHLLETTIEGVRLLMPAKFFGEYAEAC